jgi:hypothetical protein
LRVYSFTEQELGSGIKGEVEEQGLKVDFCGPASRICWEAMEQILHMDFFKLKV